METDFICWVLCTKNEPITYFDSTLTPSTNMAIFTSYEKATSAYHSYKIYAKLGTKILPDDKREDVEILQLGFGITHAEKIEKINYDHDGCAQIISKIMTSRHVSSSGDLGKLLKIRLISMICAGHAEEGYLLTYWSPQENLELKKEYDELYHHHSKTDFLICKNQSDLVEYIMKIETIHDKIVIKLSNLEIMDD